MAKLDIKTRIRVEEYSDGRKYYYPEYFAEGYKIFNFIVLNGKWLSIPESEGLSYPVRRVRVRDAEKLISEFLSLLEEDYDIKNRKLIKSYIVKGGYVD